MDNKQNDTEQITTQTPPTTSNQNAANVSGATPSEPIAATTQSSTPSGSVQPTPAVPVPSSSIPTTNTNISPSPEKKSKAMLFMMIIVLLIIVAAGAYFFFKKEASHTATTTEESMTKKTTMIPLSKPTAQITPITSSNVDQTLNTTDATMQQAMSQADTDLNSVNQIDTTQDSTTGL